MGFVQCLTVSPPKKATPAPTKHKKSKSRRAPSRRHGYIGITQRVHVPNNLVLGLWVIVIIAQVLGKYMMMGYLDPSGYNKKTMSLNTASIVVSHWEYL